MSPEKMITMANQIATFFDSQPDGKAAENVADHLRDFWAPAMRAQLQDYIASGGAGLSATAAAAARQL